MSNTSTPSAQNKHKADEVLSILREALVGYTVRFLGQAGQSITKEQAENIVSKIGLRIAIENETLAYTKKP